MDGALSLISLQLLWSVSHKGDLNAAGAVGLRTAFVPRPGEHGPDRAVDTEPDEAFDMNCSDFEDMAAKLDL